MTRAELIAALEAATEPSRELDAEIAGAAWGARTEWKQANYTMNIDVVVNWVAPHPYAGMREPCPHYTASIDAALTLVPKWWAWGFCVNETGPGGAYCDMGEHRFAATHLIPAIAICTASLKARGEVTAPA
jgi:hypothetical protein